MLKQLQMLATLQNDIMVTEEQYFELKLPSTLTKIRKQIEIHRGTKKGLRTVVTHVHSSFAPSLPSCFVESILGYIFTSSRW